MNIRNEQSAQKLRGGYYTPNDLADFLVNWILKDKQNGRILEPSAGDGVFIESLLRFNFKGTAFAVELFEEEALKILQHINERKNYSVFVEDFYDYYERFHENSSERKSI